MSAPSTTPPPTEDVDHKDVVVTMEHNEGEDVGMSSAPGLLLSQTTSSESSASGSGASSNRENVMSTVQFPARLPSPGHKHNSLPSTATSPHFNSAHLRLSMKSTFSTSSVDTSTSLNTEYNGPIIPPIHDTRYNRRTVVICFDGTGDQFDEDNSNIVHFFSLLKKSDKKRQLVYYQAGIGTYEVHTATTKLYRAASKTIDLMFAKNLKFHVMGGYKFLMQNYKEGDKICIFGFSRGAYTARALAGMIHKVGLLPPGNDQQVQFAYKTFLKDDEEGWRQSVLFKKTFSIDVDVEFVGVWDTVASVGLRPTLLPFTKSNTAIKTFRHALSLDERRVKFIPNLHFKLDDEIAKHYDFIAPELPPKKKRAKDRPKNVDRISSLRKVGDTLMKGGQEVVSMIDDVRRTSTSGGEDLSPDSERDHLEQLYLDRSKPTDALEVWFAGCHCDVGGGSVVNGTRYSLARIPLRWMIRECFRTHTGIQFEADKLYEFGVDPHSLYPRVKPRNIYASQNHEKPLPATPDTPPPPSRPSISTPREASRANDISMDGTLVGHEKDDEVEVDVRPSSDGGTTVKKRRTTVIEEKLEVPEEKIGPERSSMEKAPLDDDDDVDEPPCKWTKKTCAEDKEDFQDAHTPVYDQLKLKKWWWILEYLPQRVRVCQVNGTWKTKWLWHRGKPRQIPPDECIHVHRTVKMRMEAPDLKYKPRAQLGNNYVWVD